MKRILSLLLFLVMLCAAVTVAADDDYTMDAFSTFSYLVREESMEFVQELPETFRGKAVFALYYDLNADPLELSSSTLRDTGDFYMIPAEYLASSIDDADWAIIVYAVEKEETGENEPPLRIMIFPVDAKSGTFYQPYELDSRETILENDGNTFDLGPSIRGWDEFVLYPEWAKQYGDADEYYRTGIRFMADEKYYSAYECFCWSSFEFAVEKAQECLLPWPENGEVYHNWSVGNRDMQLTVNVSQPEDQAMEIRLIREEELVSCLFVGGTGSVTVDLPAGRYTIKDGTGTQWFGYKEAFGRDGAYETMTFDEEGLDVVELESGYAYTISINVSELSPDAEGIGSLYEDWEGFSD